MGCSVVSHELEHVVNLCSTFGGFLIGEEQRERAGHHFGFEAFLHESRYLLVVEAVVTGVACGRIVLGR